MYSMTADSPRQLPAVLQSVLAQQGLNWESDHYWLRRFRHAGKAAGTQIRSAIKSASIQAVSDKEKISTDEKEEKLKLNNTADSSLGLSSSDDDSNDSGSLTSRRAGRRGRDDAAGEGRSLGEMAREKCSEAFRAQASV